MHYHYFDIFQPSIFLEMVKTNFKEIIHQIDECSCQNIVLRFNSILSTSEYIIRKCMNFKV